MDHDSLCPPEEEAGHRQVDRPGRAVPGKARGRPLRSPAHASWPGPALSAPATSGCALPRTLGAHHGGEAPPSVQALRALLYPRAGGSDVLHGPVCPTLACQALEAAHAAKAEKAT